VNHKYEYGALMLKLEIPNWKEILHKIDKKDLYTEEPGFGVEKDPHVTVLFGLHDSVDYEKVKEMMLNNCKEPITVELGNITMFEGENYDVIKFDVTCSKLHTLNKKLTDNFPYTSDFPKYHPHVTIAYVKKGCGEKYVKNQKERKIEAYDFKYSFANKKSKTFSIT